MSLPKKVKTKGALKFLKSTKHALSMWEQVDEMKMMIGSSGTPSVAHKDINNNRRIKKNPYWCN